MKQLEKNTGIKCFILWLISLVIGTANLMAQPCFPVILNQISPSTDFVSLSWQSTGHPVGTTFEIEITQTSPQVHTPQFISTSFNQAIITDLLPATQYRVRVRANCPQGNSNWSGAFFFITHHDNQPRCLLNLPIPLNSCQSNATPFRLPIKIDQAFGTLGSTIEIINVSILIEHNRPADLSVRLISPSGKSIVLVSNHGLLQSDFGDLSTGDCSAPLTFKDQSCNTFSSPTVPLRDTVTPFQSFHLLYDGSDANGLWILEICDRHTSDQGRLQFCQISFSSTACTKPYELFLTEINKHSIGINSLASLNSETIIYEICTPENQPGTQDEKGHPDNIIHEFPATDSLVEISGLTEGTAYTIYARSKCDLGVFSVNTCGIPFETLCNHPSLRSNFDDLLMCVEDCTIQCDLDSIWRNKNGGNLQWVVNKGPTPTSNTGPNTDVFGTGNYIYVASSNPQCLQTGPAYLYSECLRLGDIDGSCALTFHLHMFGNQTGTFTLQIDTSGNGVWLNLFERIGNQGNSWVPHHIDLSPFVHTNARLRFVASPIGPRGNIALDEILFLGDIQLQEDTFIYYADRDGDGFGDPNDSISWCFPIAPEGFVANNTDCDDNNPFVNPGMDEIPCNLIDDNCSGIIDDAETDLTITDISVTPATCLGSSDGQVEVIASGGSGTYFLLLNGVEFNTFIDSLGEGLYSLILSDTEGCMILLDSIFVPAPQLVEGTIAESLGNSCPGNPDGFISLNAVGGQEPYSYIWEDGFIGNNRSDLVEGLYRVTIQDANGCSGVLDSIVLGSQAPFFIETLEIIEPICADRANGIIRLRPIGNSADFEFIWSNGELGATARSLSGGFHQVTVSQIGTNCSQVLDFVLETPDSISVRLIGIDPVSCPSGNTGRILIEAHGGTGSFTYNWSNGTQQFFQKNLTSIKSGSYELTITDQNNCRAFFGPIVVDEPAPFTINNLQLVNNRCLASDGGSISLHVTGGNGNYDYFWNNGSMTSSIQQLSNGFYVLTVVDEIGCRHIFNPIEIASSEEMLHLNITKIKDVTCFGNQDGKIVVQSSNGIPPFEFHWSNGRRTVSSVPEDSVVQMRAGTYGVTLTDREGCINALPSITIDGPTTPLSFSVVEVSPVSCYGEQSGRIHIDFNGGILPYSITWSNGQQGNIAQNLTKGLYSFLLKDANGCELSAPPIEISEPEELLLQISFQEDNCATGLGSIQAFLSGGIAPYNYNWLFEADTINGSSIQNLLCGSYHLIANDFNGCTVDTTLFLGTTSIQEEISIQKHALIYPNPCTHELFIAIDRTLNEMGTLQIVDVHGKILDTHAIGFNQMHINLAPNMTPGVYFMILSWSNHREIHKIIKQ